MAASEPVSGIIFDLDGTLADTIADLAGAVNATLAEHMLPTFMLEDFKLMVGDGFSALMQKALPALLASDPGIFESLVATARSRYQAECLETTEPFPGILELLSRLGSQGVACAVLSNKPQSLSLMIVEALFPGFPFVAVLGERPGIPRKPDPQGALEIARMAGIPARSWALVGDSGIDMRTAARAGMRAWGAAWGYRSAEELLEGGAESLFASPADILIPHRQTPF